MFRRPVKERYIVLAISSELAMEDEHERIMVETIESHNPSYWRRHTPGSYLVYFRFKDRKSTDRANELYETVADLIKGNDNFAHLKIGINEGMLISEVNLIGGVTFEPLGEAVNEAYRLQKGKSELISSS